MRDSYMIVYHGPIRGGKTVSMTADIATDMLNGRQAFTNYPIEFDYQEDEDSPIKHYASEELIPDELLLIDKPEFKKKYTDCVIGWDEGALSLPAREFASAQNKLTSQTMLLRGKLEASIYFTVQYLSMWERNMRLQEDTLVFCHDLSFKFTNLERGSTISQAFQDMSGRSTGETFDESQMYYRQTFRAKMFWPIYDTKRTFSVVRDKIKYGDVRATLQNGDWERSDEYQLQQEDENRVVLSHLIEELKSQNQTRILGSILMNMAKQRGFQGRASDMGAILMSEGMYLTANGIWRIPENVVIPI